MCSSCLFDVPRRGYACPISMVGLRLAALCLVVVLTEEVWCLMEDQHVHTLETLTVFRAATATVSSGLLTVGALF